MLCVVSQCKLSGDDKLTNPFDALRSLGRKPFSLDVTNSLLATFLFLVSGIAKFLERTSRRIT